MSKFNTLGLPARARLKLHRLKSTPADLAHEIGITVEELDKACDGDPIAQGSFDKVLEFIRPK